MKLLPGNDDGQDNDLLASSEVFFSRPYAYAVASSSAYRTLAQYLSWLLASIYTRYRLEFTQESHAARTCSPATPNAVSVGVSNGRSGASSWGIGDGSSSGLCSKSGICGGSVMPEMRSAETQHSRMPSAPPEMMPAFSDAHAERTAPDASFVLGNMERFLKTMYLLHNRERPVGMKNLFTRILCLVILTVRIFRSTHVVPAWGRHIAQNDRTIRGVNERHGVV